MCSYHFPSACIRWCCPCCLRGEPEEKPRVKVAYAKDKSPNNPDENVNLLKPDELQENTEKDTEETKVKPTDTEGGSESSHGDKDEGIGEDMEEFTEENGMRVRRVVTKTVTTTSTKTSSDDGEPKHPTRETLQKESGQAGQAGGDTDENTEVREYVDENGRRVRRIVKTITTTSTRITSKNNGPSSVTTETKEINSGGHDPEKILINFGGGTPRPSEEHSKLQSETKPRAIQEKEVFLQFGSKPPVTQESHVKVDIKGQPFQTHNINMFESRGHTTITTGTSAGDNRGNDTVYQRSVITKTIGGGDGGTKIVEHSTKTSSQNGEHPIVVVKKEKSQIIMPEWMVEQSSPDTKGKTSEMSDISVHLKYSSDYNPKNKDLEPSVNESRIHPEVAKRDKPVISMISLDDVVKEKEKQDAKKPEKIEKKSEPPQPADEDDEDEDEDEEEDDGEVDEFEEEIVVMEVRRKPRFHKALEIPEPEPEKAGVPIEGLLELPTMEVGQESAPDENLIDEKVEAEERPPTTYEEPDFEELFKDN